MDHASTGMTVALKDVHLSYGEGQPILRGVSLDVPAGCTLAIVGVSGAGKSSIARLLLGLIEPDAGAVLWNQRRLHGLEIEHIRRLIGVVPQDTVLFDDTVANNIRIGRPDATQQEVESAARSACLHEVVQGMPEGYDTPVGERGLKLSGGERQRLAIARAILKRPALFLLDEPTSMLDVQTEAEVLQQLRSHAAGCTTIVITHRLATITHADEIVVIQQGVVVERGHHAQLLARGQAYASMWRSQSGKVQKHGPTDSRCQRDVDCPRASLPTSNSA